MCKDKANVGEAVSDAGYIDNARMAQQRGVLSQPTPLYMLTRTEENFEMVQYGPYTAEEVIRIQNGVNGKPFAVLRLAGRKFI